MGERRVAHAFARIAASASFDLGGAFDLGPFPGSHGPSSRPEPSGLWSGALTGEVPA